MNNNDILRRIRYTFNYDDFKSDLTSLDPKMLQAICSARATTKESAAEHFRTKENLPYLKQAIEVLIE